MDETTAVFAFTPFSTFFFRRRTSVPVSRGLGRQREIACFGGSVDTLTRNIMIFSKDIIVLHSA